MANLPLKPAAERLGISPHTLRFWAVYRGLVPYVRLGRRIVFRPEDLDEFERRHRVEARER
jgi:DNA-binding transcriptional MerR regulator